MPEVASIARIPAGTWWVLAWTDFVGFADAYWTGRFHGRGAAERAEMTLDSRLARRWRTEAEAEVALAVDLDGHDRLQAWQLLSAVDAWLPAELVTGERQWWLGRDGAALLMIPAPVQLTEA